MSSANPESESDEPDLHETDPRLTELVAYLDGELSAEESERVEQELAAQPALRRNADGLDRTWQMLNALEDAGASGEFTKRTLASIRTVSTPEAQLTQPSLHNSRIRTVLSVAAPALLCTTVGFIGTAIGLNLARNAPAATPQDRQLLQNFDLLQNYQNMRQIPDAQFLQQLANTESPTAGTQP